MIFFIHSRYQFFADEPEIDVEAEKVHSGLGKEAHLTCIVHGEPRPSVRTLPSKSLQLTSSVWSKTTLIGRGTGRSS